MPDRRINAKIDFQKSFIMFGAEIKKQADMNLRFIDHILHY